MRLLYGEKKQLIIALIPKELFLNQQDQREKNDLITIRVARFLPLFAIKIHVELMTLNI